MKIHPPLKNQGEKVKAANRKRFKTWLAHGLLASDDTSVEEWVGMATNVGANGFNDVTGCITFCVRAHRHAGGDLPRYARQVANYAEKWALEKAQTERIAKESA